MNQRPQWQGPQQQGQAYQGQANAHRNQFDEFGQANGNAGLQGEIKEQIPPVVNFGQRAQRGQAGPVHIENNIGDRFNNQNIGAQHRGHVGQAPRQEQQ